MAERDDTIGRAERRRLHTADEVDLLERDQGPGPAEGDLEDGDTETEDSGAGSFLDRFVRPRRPRG